MAPGFVLWERSATIASLGRALPTRYSDLPKPAAPLVNMQKPSENSRRIPSQRRAQATVDTLLEAVAQILERDGAASLTTNRVAERAGFSIGTLYGYFPNKRALLLALVEREARKQETLLEQLLVEGRAIDVDSLIRAVLRSVLRPFEDRRRLQVALVRLFFGDRDIVNAAAIIGERLMPMLSAGIDRARGTIAEGRTQLSRQATLGAVIGAVLTLGRADPASLRTPEVEDELVRILAQGFAAA